MEKAYLAGVHESFKKGQGRTPEEIHAEGIKQKSEF